MNSGAPNGGMVGNTTTWIPLADDRQGARYLYGNGASEVDAAPMQLRDAGTASNGWRLAAPQFVSPTTISRGGVATVSYTFSNLGTSRIAFDDCWYLTGGPSGTVQIYYGTGAWADPGSVGNYTRQLTVPTWIAAGNYRFKYRVDCSNANVESYEGPQNEFTIVPWVSIQ